MAEGELDAAGFAGGLALLVRVQDHVPVHAPDDPWRKCPADDLPSDD